MDTPPKADAYSQVLESCEKYLQKEIISDSFEDCLRKASLMKGYLLYTIDKLLELNQDLMAYQRRVDGLLGMKDLLFKIELNKNTKMADMDTESKSNAYIESCMMSAPTEGVLLDRYRKVFLRGNLLRENDVPE
ncbi:Transcriptional regulatory protein sin3 [Rhizina undulata]